MKHESTEMRRVLFISYSFPPSTEMGAYSCAQIARYLPLYGWEPVVLTVREKHIDDILHLPPGRILARASDRVALGGALPRPVDHRDACGAPPRQDLFQNQPRAGANDDLPRRRRGLRHRRACGFDARGL